MVRFCVHCAQCAVRESTPVLHAQPQQIQSAHHVEAVQLERDKILHALERQLEDVVIVLLARFTPLHDQCQTL